ncbi:hypothetical protein CBM2592_B110107 [Cupriavidus taiwanensis]|nr:hypothetical protein CBM2592_B110107 [Cupriavidus taiwanensis]SOY63644.1 hypothetical protein CBM2588_B140102 [Cupriavidus taiwanensis]SOY93773.1 hypothetical protein CBM2591_B100080 [Cupriavidus taiwanensis]SOZ77407.1 hypothetical protein CBM2617_U10173 [Cupriavidus taiwanensis]SOZ85453.1 hypothetical protein CBM2618_B130194 [Cupriavidus taiwanensis]
MPNLPAFDYAFNLSYRQEHTAAEPLFAASRAMVGEQTRERAAGAEAERGPGIAPETAGHGRTAEWCGLSDGRPRCCP